MKKVSVADFKMYCIKLLKDVNEFREEVVITKRGEPVAKLIPFDKKKKRNFIGCMEGTGEIVGDIVSPIDVEWEADSKNV